MRRILILVMGFGLVAAAPGDRWAKFAECGDANHLHIYAYDPAALKSRGGKKLVPINVDYSRDPASRARSARLLWSLDCTGRTYFEQSRTDYRANRSVVASYRKASETMTIIPDSVADKLARKVCV